MYSKHPGCDSLCELLVFFQCLPVGMAEVYLPRVFGCRESDPTIGKGCLPRRKSVNIADYLEARTLGHSSCQNAEYRLRSEFGTIRLLESELLRHFDIPLSRDYNKIFCSQWLSDSHVIFGTKCNKLVVVNVVTKNLVEIPMLEGISSNNNANFNSCGVHCISISPSRTLLATGGRNCNDVAVYSLPTLHPVCIGEHAHQDWIFDICWLDDEHFVTGSRDTSIALWRIEEYMQQTAENQLQYVSMHPIKVKTCKAAEKVRSLAVNDKLREFVVLSLNSYLHIWDAEEFIQKQSIKLAENEENVCLAVNKDCSMYAVGSKYWLTLYDSRLHSAVKRVSVKNYGKNIRSVSFNSDTVTMGNGIGILSFYNCTAGKFVMSSNSCDNTCCHKSSTCRPVFLFAKNGLTLHEDLDQPNFFPPAIFTHCYNAAGTALFAAGGPLPVNFQGNFAAVWQ